MLVDFLFNWIDVIVNALKGTIPDLGFDPSTNGGIVAIISYIYTFDNWLPIHDALVPILGFYLVQSTIYLVLKIIKLVLSWIP